MSDITKIKIDNEREHSYKDFPANREFKKRAEDDNPGGGGWPADLPLPTSGGYGYTEESEEQKTVVTFTGTGDNIYISESAYDNPPIDWKVGDTLTITINGTIYKVPMRSDPMDQEGDEGMVGWDAGAPRNPDSYWDIDWSDYDFLLHISWYYGEFDGGYVKIKDGEGTYDISATVGAAAIIHKIDEKYIPESGRWPSDLPKPSADGYGWVEENKGVTIADGTFHDAAILTSDFALVEGQTYDVVFNGTEYNDLIAFDDYDYITIGASFGNYTVYPFCISNDTDGIHLYMQESVDCTILITTGRSETIHKIDEKYLPASGNEPDLVFVINKHFDGELSKTDVSIETGTIADFVEKMEDGNAKCVIKYHNVSEPGNAVTYGEITNVMVERYETGVYFHYLYAGGGYGISVVMIECNTNGTIVNVFKQDPGSSTN